MAEDQMLNEETPADKKEEDSTLKKTLGERGQKVYPYDGQQEEDDRTVEELSPAEKAGKAGGNLAVLQEIYDRANAGVNLTPKEREKDEERILMVGEAIAQGIGNAESIELLKKLGNSGYHSAMDALNKLKEEGKVKEDGVTPSENINEEDKEKDNKGSIIDGILEENRAQERASEFEAIREKAEAEFDKGLEENRAKFNADVEKGDADFDAQRAEIEKSFNENMKNVQGGSRTAGNGGNMDEVKGRVSEAVQEALKNRRQH